MTFQPGKFIILESLHKPLFCIFPHSTSHWSEHKLMNNNRNFFQVIFGLMRCENVLFLKEETKPTFRICFKLCSCILKYTKGLGGGLFSINSSLITLLIMFNENEKFFCLLWFVVLAISWGMQDLTSPIRDPNLRPLQQKPSLSHWMAREVPESCHTEHFFFLLLHRACTTFDWPVKTSEIFSEV